MNTRIWRISLFVCVCCLAGHAEIAYAAGARELINDAGRYDGRDIVMEGEVMTAVMERGDGSWVCVNDGSGSIGVVCGKEDAAKIVFAGGYKKRGDIIEVRGVFNRACAMHNGDLDIHARELRIVERGRLKARDFDYYMLYSSLWLWVLVLLLAVVFRKIT